MTTARPMPDGRAGEPRSQGWVWLVLGLLVLASLAVALAAGSVPVGMQDMWRALTGQGGGMAVQVVQELRLPRALAAFATGGLLALAGALMQVLLRNPLADPYVLGVSGGAAVAALVSLGAGAAGWVLTGSAFAGALFSMWLVFVLARGPGAWSSTRLLLTGVVVSAGWGAMISFLLAMAPQGSLKGMLFWLMGDLSQAAAPWPGLILLALALAVVWPWSRALNVVARGELQAASLGVDTRRVRTGIYVIGSLCTAGAVTLAGGVGFVGLIVPHLLRLVMGNDHRLLLPAAVLFGGALLTLADTLARTALAPQQLPVGVVTAFMGVPLFLFLLRRSGR